MTFTFKHTRAACYMAYVSQAIINSFLPLLFLTFQKSYGIALDKIALLVTVNFCVQLVVDALAAKYVDRIGYKRAMVIAHLLSGLGLCLLAVLPRLITPYHGIVTAVIVYAVGGGLIEVVVSPIIEACPSDNKESEMSFLHSFYCWGVLAVILLSTLFFAVFTIERWPYLAVLFALVPLANAFFFVRVPVNALVETHEGMRMTALFRKPVFWVLLLLMICSGASEQAVGQWVSAFAEAGLKLSKAAGDLMGPCVFALLMGLTRLLHTRISEKIGLKAFMTVSTLLCILGYGVLSLEPPPVIGMLSCAACGIGVGILWPGTFSLAAQALKKGGTALFALLALGGDVGCALGPAVVGVVSKIHNDALSAGFLAAIIFPICLLVGVRLLAKVKTDAAGS